MVNDIVSSLYHDYRDPGNAWPLGTEATAEV
jgi:hypothetical protein